MNEAELRVSWEKWATQTFAGDAQRISTATSAALRALKEGATSEEAARRAKSAVMLGEPHPKPPPQFDIFTARQQWSIWALREIVGDADDRANAMEAVVQALVSGKTPQEAMATGRAAVKPTPAGAIRGRVSGLKQRYDMVGRISVPVWSFRLQRFSDTGTLLQPITVDIKGGEFVGSISENDVVQIADTPNSLKGTVVLKALSNLTTGEPFGTPKAIKQLMSNTSQKADLNKWSIGVNAILSGAKLLWLGLPILGIGFILSRVRGGDNMAFSSVALIIAGVYLTVSGFLKLRRESLLR